MAALAAETSAATEAMVMAVAVGGSNDYFDGGGVDSGYDDGWAAMAMAEGCGSGGDGGK